MATSTPSTLPAADFGQVEVATTELDGYTVNLLHFKQPVDMSPMVRGLPGDISHPPRSGNRHRGTDDGPVRRPRGGRPGRATSST